jgi:uncharacterized protein
MSEIQFYLEGNRGKFFMEENNEEVAEMEIGLRDGNVTVYHTEVADHLKGKGVAGKLLEAMVAYARKNNLKVIALCPYVYAQFLRHPDQYADIWNKDWKK